MTAPQDALAPIRALYENQPWFKRFSNTVTGGVGALVQLAWLATTFGVDLPDDVEKWGFVVIGVLTVLGLRKTPNGITEQQLHQMEQAYVGRHRRDG
ncbi:hypothetical protein ACW2Q0_28150 [Nocardia sp. R16R-3T]